jgi:hypothetical protein
VGYNGLADNSYNSRIPNEPYLFSNLRSGFTFFTDNYQKFTAHWSSHYVEQYFLYSESSGYKDENRQIPEQLTHDIDIAYSKDHEQFNIGFTASNISDETVFDNYNIQKPGRAYYLKFRYSL